MKRKILALSLCFTFLAAALAGCGSGQSSPSSGTGGVASDTLASEENAGSEAGEAETAKTTAGTSSSETEDTQTEGQETAESSENSDSTDGSPAAGALEFSQDTSNNVPADYYDVPYASQSDSQVCNIYLPKSDETEDKFPTIVLVHGGGFAMETQNEVLIQPVIEKALENNYAVVSVDYRKSSEAVFPAALSDVKAAVRWIRANAEEYMFDPDNITIWGESAGGWLSLMTALTPNVEELNGDVEDNSSYSSSVRNLVDFYGPVEFYTMDEEFKALGMDDCANHSDASSFESAFLGQALDVDKEKTYETYWETYKDKLDKDFVLKAWIQAGSNDQNVPYTQGENFSERLSKTIDPNAVQFGLIDGAGHMDEAFYTDENLDAIFEWC